MKPGIVADEMFPEGTSAIMDIDDEVLNLNKKKPKCLVSVLNNCIYYSQTGGSVGFEMNEKNLQTDFYNGKHLEKLRNVLPNSGRKCNYINLVCLGSFIILIVFS